MDGNPFPMSCGARLAPWQVRPGHKDPDLIKPLFTKISDTRHREGPRSILKTAALVIKKNQQFTFIPHAPKNFSSKPIHIFSQTEREQKFC